MLYGIAAATAALLLTALLAALLRGPALRVGLVDRRQRQRRPALSGGVAVVLTTCLVAAAGDWTGAAPLGEDMGVLLLAGGGVAALGLVVDLWRLKARFVVAGTAVAAAFVVPYGDTGVVAGVAAVGWIACVAFAFRALDHADGVAGTVGVVTAFGVGACAAADMMDGLAVLLSVLAAALTGFLMHNWPPARVALGGCGALFTGFLLAAAAVSARAGRDAVAGAAVLFALTAVAAADVVLVLLARRTAGRPLLRRGPDHLAHRLRRLGLTPQGVTVLLGTAAFAGVLVGALVHAGWADARAVLWVAGGVLVVVLGLWRVPVYARRPGEDGAAARRPGEGGGATRRPGEGGGAARRPGEGVSRRGSGEGGVVRRGPGEGMVRRGPGEGALRRGPGEGGARLRARARQPSVPAVQPPRRSTESPARALRRAAS
ncbi:MraY family glycosyltransferase [Streptomyces sp. NPDC059894]|uniref:MraY family glycosyltransferase n=1 Tax=unclassified Streptomyces TaxID=2593676 RepID=UPI0036628EC1